MTDFESAMKKVADVVHAAARKSGEIFENTKISYNISTEKDKITKLQSKIGEKFYRIYKDGGAVPEAIVEELEKIAAIDETIRALEKTLADSKPYKFCSDCGAKLDLSDVYCAKCGAKQHDASQKADAKGGGGECGPSDCCSSESEASDCCPSEPEAADCCDTEKQDGPCRDKDGE